MNPNKCGCATVKTIDELQSTIPDDCQKVSVLGYYEAGDGGHNDFIYRATGRSEVTTNFGTLIAGSDVDDYFAALNQTEVDVRQFGVSIGGNTDNTGLLNNMFASGVTKVNVPNGKIRCEGTVNLPNQITITGEGDSSIFDFTYATISGIIGGELVSNSESLLTQLPVLSTDIKKGDQTLTFTSPPSISPNDWLTIYNPNDFSWSGHRNYYRAGEYVQVQKVDANVVTIQGSSRDSYTAEDVVVYQIATPAKINISGISIQGPTVTGQQVYGLRLKHIVDSSIESVSSTASYYGIGLSTGINVTFTNCRASDDLLATFGGDYGLTIGNSQSVKVIGGTFVAGRHAIAVGGSGFIGNVVNRDIKIIGATLITTGGVQAADCHGNSENITFQNCTIQGGLILRGDKCNAFDNYITSRNVNQPTITFGEMKGGNFTISRNLIEANANSPSRGCFFDMGGNSIKDLNAGTRDGGIITISDNKLEYVGTEDTGFGMRLMNRGYVGTEKIHMRYKNNSLLSKYGAEITYSVVVNALNGSFGTIVIDGNKHHAGGVRMINTGTNTIEHVDLDSNIFGGRRLISGAIPVTENNTTFESVV